MKVGASQYHPGLAVRWESSDPGLTALFAPRHGTMLFVAANGPRAWVVESYTPGVGDDRSYTRRCDAKRAAEVLVGQWWREKCEREAKAREWQWRAVCRKAAEVRGIVTADYADGTSEQVEVTTNRAGRTLSPLGQLFVNGIREDMFGTTKIRECVPEYGE